MLNKIWAGMIIFSFIYAGITGKMEFFTSSILNGAADAVQLLIGMCGMMCAWTGLLKIAEAGGLTKLFAKIMRPVLRRLFPEYPPESPAAHAICMNLTANLLGIGNAATPMGLAAMQEMEKLNPHKGTANNSMVMFVVLNTASIQLVPTFLGTLRAQFGAANPFDILPSIWITSAASVLVAIAAVKLLEKRT